MTVKISRETFEQQQVVTRDIYSPEGYTVNGTADDEIAMGTIMIVDQTAPDEIKVLVAGDLPTLGTDFEPQLVIAKEDKTLITDADFNGGFLAMGEVIEDLTNIGTFTEPQQAIIKTLLNKTGIYTISSISIV
jgi:hypothetical protein